MCIVIGSMGGRFVLVNIVEYSCCGGNATSATVIKLV